MSCYHVKIFYRLEIFLLGASIATVSNKTQQSGPAVFDTNAMYNKYDTTDTFHLSLAAYTQIQTHQLLNHQQQQFVVQQQQQQQPLQPQQAPHQQQLQAQLPQRSQAQLLQATAIQPSLQAPAHTVPALAIQPITPAQQHHQNHSQTQSQTQYSVALLPKAAQPSQQTAIFHSTTTAGAAPQVFPHNGHPPALSPTPQARAKPMQLAAANPQAQPALTTVSVWLFFTSCFLSGTDIVGSSR